MIGAWALVRLSKLNVQQRYFHIRFVAVSVLFAVLASVFFVNILQLLNKILSIKKIQEFLFNIMPGANVSSAFFWVVTILSCLLLSVLYLIVMLTVKRVWVKPVAQKNDTMCCNRFEKMLNSLSEHFYDNNGSTYALTPKAYNIGKWLRYMRIFFGMLIVGEAVTVPLYLHFGLSVIDDALLSRIVKSLFMIPLVSFFVIDQAEVYLVGDEKNYSVVPDSDSTQSRQFGNFKLFGDLFEHYFGGEALIHKHFFEERQVAQKNLFSDLGDDQLERAGKNSGMLQAIHNAVLNAVSEDSPHFTEALIDLVNGKSVAVFDTVKGEFNLYYLAYLQSNLFLRRKALVVCDTAQQAKEIEKQYKAIFKRLNKLHPIWRISTPDNMDDKNTDILICTEEQLINGNIISNHREFIDRLHDVVVLDTYAILCRNSSFVLRFFDTLYRNHVQFMFFVSENNLDIKTALRSYINGADIELYENFRSNAETCVFCWRAESYYKTQSVISKNLNDYFGLAYTLAVIAAKYDVSGVQIHAPESIPIETYAGVVAKNERVIAQSIFQREGVILDAIVKHNPIIAFEPQALSFDIVYDENNNLLDVAQLMISDAGTVSSVINIVSRPYMLRDYLAHKIQLMNDNYSGVMQLVPSYFCDDIKSPSVALLIKLREKGQTCEKILRFMANFGVKDKNVEEVLALVLQSVMGDLRRYKVYECFSFDREKPVFADGEYHYTRVVHLTDESVYREACRLTINYVRITGEYEDVLPIDKNIVYNRYLPGQIHSFGYRRYRINHIENSTLFVESEETVEREYEYSSAYKIDSLELETQTESAFENRYFSCDLMTGTAQRTIFGYFTHINGLDFTGDHTQFSELSDQITETKQIHALRVTVNFPFGEQYQKAALLLKALFCGALETLLPKNYKDLLVLTKAAQSEFGDVDFYENSEEIEHLRPDPIPSDWEGDTELEQTPSLHLLQYFVPEIDDSTLMGNNEERIHLYVLDFNEINNGVTDTISKNIERIFSVMRSYLEWYIANPQEKHAYLNFGCDHIPDLFDSVAVNACLERVAMRINEPDEVMTSTLEITDSTDVKFCDFCGRPITVSGWKFDDERMMCESCKEHVCNEREEVEVLLKKAYNTLESFYGIEVPREDNIKIRFKSATAIRKKVGINVPNKRVLGFYDPRTKELWVERGGPEACVLSTLIHEMTHAWQFANIDVSKRELKYIEGHAVYVELECLRKLAQTVYADFMENNLIAGNDDVYCRGYLMWCEKMKNEADKNIFHLVLKEDKF